MSRSGIRPHLWKYPGEVQHEQHYAWLRSKAQANFRGEVWLLTFEEYKRLWMGLWELRGRGNTDYCITREDPQGAWAWGNVICLPRVEHLRNQRRIQMQRRARTNGKTNLSRKTNDYSNVE